MLIQQISLPFVGRDAHDLQAIRESEENCCFPKVRVAVDGRVRGHPLGHGGDEGTQWRGHLLRLLHAQSGICKG